VKTNLSDWIIPDRCEIICADCLPGYFMGYTNESNIPVPLLWDSYNGRCYLAKDTQTLKRIDRLNLKSKQPQMSPDQLCEEIQAICKKFIEGMVKKQLD